MSRRGGREALGDDAGRRACVGVWPDSDGSSSLPLPASAGSSGPGVCQLIGTVVNATGRSRSTSPSPKRSKAAATSGAATPSSPPVSNDSTASWTVSISSRTTNAETRTSALFSVPFWWSSSFSNGLPLQAAHAVLIELEISLHGAGVRHQIVHVPVDLGAFKIVGGDLDAGQGGALCGLVGERCFADVDAEPELVGRHDLVVVHERRWLNEGAGIGVSSGVDRLGVGPDAMVQLSQWVGHQYRRPRFGDAGGIDQQGCRPDGRADPFGVGLQRDETIDRRLQPSGVQLPAGIEGVLQRGRQVGGDVGTEV